MEMIRRRRREAPGRGRYLHERVGVQRGAGAAGEAALQAVARAHATQHVLQAPRAPAAHAHAAHVARTPRALQLQPHHGAPLHARLAPAQHRRRRLQVDARFTLEQPTAASTNSIRKGNSIQRPEMSDIHSVISTNVPKN